jgi:hypothetical protein
MDYSQEGRPIRLDTPLGEDVLLLEEPFSVVLVIEHKDPMLQYHGTVTHTNEDTRDFVFSGALDGKEYAMVSSIGPGITVLHRVDANTLESAFRNADGTRLETALTSLSRHGKV